MAYCNYLYNARNIIGYTGKVDDSPTVYFQLGRAYGHITQDHPTPINIGREEVAIHAGYHIDNYQIDGAYHSVEWEGREPIHMSRTAFVRREFFNPGDILTLSIALYRFPDIKLRYVKQCQSKSMMQAELLNQFNDVNSIRRLQLFHDGVDKNPKVTRIIESHGLGR